MDSISMHIVSAAGKETTILFFWVVCTHSSVAGIFKLFNRCVVLKIEDAV